ncbi:ATPase [Vibrio caribbeanicus]|uniref:ATPase n=1 Tax=Vibrio caribbeanicus TaxID=701175 RepID=A0ACC4P0P3_9VIBR|nr:ATPase [Vibrio caribbeanicus]
MNHNQFENKEHEPLIDIGYYAHIIKSRWISIFLFTVLCSAISILVALSLTPTYKATATLLIESSQKKAISIEEIVGIDTRAKEYYQTQFEILKSNQVAQRVIDKLDLKQYPEFNPSLKNTENGIVDFLKKSITSNSIFRTYFPEDNTPEISDSVKEEKVNRGVLNIFKSKLTISPIRNTQLVRISFESTSPSLSADVANEVARAFIENNLESKLLATKQATSWINTRLAELKNKLDVSERALLTFLEKQELIDDSGIIALTSSELANLTDRISEATERRIETQALYNALKGSTNTDATTLASISTISNHPQIRDIRSAESEAEKRVSELAKRYGPKHDKMIQANAQLKSIKLRADKVIKKLVNGIGKELDSAKQQEQLLKKELINKKDEFQSLSVVKREYDALKREVDTNAKLYDLFLTRQKETSATSDFSASNARFSDYALVPESPSKPNRKMIVVLTVFFSAGFAMALVIIIDAFNNKISTARDFENKLGLLPTGTIPLVKDKKYRNKAIDYEVFNDKKYNVFHESLDSIRTSLYLNMQTSKRKVIAISSSVPEEGKTTASINLAKSFSKLERVLLIDCDLRKPSISRRFDLPQSQMGLANIILMNAPVRDCIVSIPNTKLDVLTAGMIAPNAQELLSSKMFSNLIERLSDKYDRIIIDTPPVLPVKDAFIIGRLTKGIVLIVKSNSTTKSVFKHSMTLFAKHEITLDGVVLNQVVAPRKGTHTYSEYANYAYSHESNK